MAKRPENAGKLIAVRNDFQLNSFFALDEAYLLHSILSLNACSFVVMKAFRLSLEAHKVVQLFLSIGAGDSSQLRRTVFVVCAVPIHPGRG